MEKYGDNKWWESENLKEIAYYQFNEDVLLIDFVKYHEAMEKLLGRSVFTHEFGLNIEGLKQEVEKAWNNIPLENSDIRTIKGINSIYKLNGIVKH